ncbi:MAG: SGNH/GDSL hydrolase family protein [Solirubrobacteraceae bacterium]
MRRLTALMIATTAVLAAAGVPSTAAAAPTTGAPQYLLALGDSYAVGYQANVGHTTRNGPASQLVGIAARRGLRLRLVDLGCGGATTHSMLTQLDCPATSRLPGAAGYPRKTQVQAAVAFLRGHRGHVALVTISIGGNDVDGCIPQANPLACVRANMPAAVGNLKRILRQLRAAGGPKVRIVGSTYPDVVLGAWVKPSVFGANRFTLVSESLTAFRSVINPGLHRAYASAHAGFVDVTAATGAYGPFYSVSDPPYGVVPQPVAEACRLTFFCSYLDIHMTTAGYAIIARLEAPFLPDRRRARGA